MVDWVIVIAVVAALLSLSAAVFSRLSGSEQETEQAPVPIAAWPALMAHDIGQVSGTLLLLAERLRARPIDDELRDVALSIRFEAEFLASIADDAIMTYRAQIGRLEPRRSPVSILGLVESVAKALAKTAKVPVRVVLGERAAQGESLTLDADEDQLRTALTNLIRNAISLSPPGVPVRVGVDSGPETVEVSVTEQGSGIPADKILKLFEPFHVEKGEAFRDRPGVGFGLYVGRSIVEAHGGRVWVESGPGKGLTFRLQIPRRAPF